MKKQTKEELEILLLQEQLTQAELKTKYMQRQDAQLEPFYTRKKVIELLDNMLQHSDHVMDAITNEYTDWDGDALLKLSEETIGVTPTKKMIKEFKDENEPGGE